MTFHARDSVPLDFRQMLDLLASWEGRQVRVFSSPHAPGKPLTHTQTVMAGALGKLQMVDNAIDRSIESVAAFSIGPMEPNGFYISPGDFRQAQPLSGESVRLDFENDYAIQVDVTG